MKTFVFSETFSSTEAFILFLRIHVHQDEPTRQQRKSTFSFCVLIISLKTIQFNEVTGLFLINVICIYPFCSVKVEKKKMMEKKGWDIVRRFGIRIHNISFSRIIENLSSRIDSPTATFSEMITSYMGYELLSIREKQVCFPVNCILDDLTRSKGMRL